MGKTDKKREKFLEVLSETANVTYAAQVSGLPRCTAYRWREENEEFATLWAQAVSLGVEALEDEARRRAQQGTLKPVFYQGKEVGQIREYSDTLMIVLLKAHKPEKYRENYTEPEGNEDIGGLEVVEYED